MAEDNKKKNEDESKFYTTKPTTQLDAERRLEEGYVADAVTGNTVTVNPNPFGDEDYVGTDPIYQNYAEETHKPGRSEEGVEKELEEAYREQHNLDDLDDDQVAEDYGLGGKARVARTNSDAGPTVWKVPGQEGYPEDDEYDDRPARPVQTEGNTRTGDAQPTKADNPGTNFGATTEPGNPSDPSDRAGSRKGKTE